MAVISFAGHCEKLLLLLRTSWQNLREAGGEGKKSREGDE